MDYQFIEKSSQRVLSHLRKKKENPNNNYITIHRSDDHTR